MIRLASALLLSMLHCVWSAGRPGACRCPCDKPQGQTQLYTKDNVADLFDEFWRWRLERSPEFSTLTGSKVNNRFLETYTEQRFKEDKITCEGYLARASSLYDTDLDPDDKLNLRFLMADLQTFIDGYPFKGFYFPINYMQGVQVDFQELTSDWVSLDNVTDYEDIIARYNAFPQLADQIIQMMRTAMSKNKTNHAVSMKGVGDQIMAYLGNPRETAFFKPFLAISDLPQQKVIKLQEEALAAIKGKVQPGFRKLYEFLEGEYAKATRPHIRLSTLPGNGFEFYKACLAFHTSTDLTTQQIHQKGLDEVFRIEEGMKDIIKEMGYDLSLQDFTEMIRNDKNNFFESPEELLAAFTDIVENKIDQRLEDIFHKKPAIKLEIIETPANTPNAPSAQYMAGTPDGKRPGRFAVNTNKYKSQPKYELVSLALHESNPGHHLQSSYMLEKEKWPLFRKFVEDIRYSHVPSRFPINTAFGEGWGLYSESLGFDLGLYDDPLDRYGHLSQEMLRACRLVVDTGMHALGWSREKARQFMLKHTASTPETISSEVDRYVTLPAQATAYKIGELKIRELRTKAETQLGDKFNIKDFHEVVLRSAGPLYILEEQVDLYIDATK